MTGNDSCTWNTVSCLVVHWVESLLPCKLNFMFLVPFYFSFGSIVIPRLGVWTQYCMRQCMASIWTPFEFFMCLAASQTELLSSGLDHCFTWMSFLMPEQKQAIFSFGNDGLSGTLARMFPGIVGVFERLLSRSNLAQKICKITSWVNVRPLLSNFVMLLPIYLFISP